MVIARTRWHSRLSIGVVILLVGGCFISTAQDTPHQSAGKGRDATNQLSTGDQDSVLNADAARSATDLNAQIGCTGVNSSTGFVKLSWTTADGDR